MRLLTVTEAFLNLLAGPSLFKNRAILIPLHIFSNTPSSLLILIRNLQKQTNYLSTQYWQKYGLNT